MEPASRIAVVTLACTEACSNSRHWVVSFVRKFKLDAEFGLVLVYDQPSKRSFLTPQFAVKPARPRREGEKELNQQHYV